MSCPDVTSKPVILVWLILRWADAMGQCDVSTESIAIHSTKLRQVECLHEAAVEALAIPFALVCNVREHIQWLRQILLMEAGDAMHRFWTSLFHHQQQGLFSHITSAGWSY